MMSLLNVFFRHSLLQNKSCEMKAFKLQESDCICVSGSCSSEVRIGHSLNTEEKEFIARREQTVQESLKTLGIPCQDKVPKIALLGSGGGERAMLGLLGSLDGFKETGLLDCVLYLSGVSGSTWCMASLYQDSDWSTKLDSVREKIIQRLKGPAVSWSETFSKLKKYYHEKDLFSLTDVWAVLIVTSFVKEIDERTISEKQGHNEKDPFPIFTVIDKECKQLKKEDPWVEITPYEAGYSLTGAFVDVSRFGSQFEKGSKIKDQPEVDMLYLQSLCGSALADEQNIWEAIKDFFKNLFQRKEENLVEVWNEIPSSSIDDAGQILMDLVEMNLLTLKGKDTSDLDKTIRTKLLELSGGKTQLIFPVEKPDKSETKLYMKQFTLDVCDNMGVTVSFWPFDMCYAICKCVVQWIWGRKYNCLYNMKDGRLPSILVESEKRDYEDAGLLLNSPYMSVLRQERDIDLIISLDFSDGDPFMTVKDIAKICKRQNIPFPEVIVPSGDIIMPKDFYVFEGYTKAPTVIHIPLFNTVNCGDKVEEWRKKYTTFQLSYRAELIDPLLEVAGKNITNNKEKLLEEIRKIMKR
ncbi:cytosolic phospholipase A2 gamma-like isoform X2 [Triplophysa dalaica]|uniref:cytosolic phospholipase A2 gamma-like isoform X2 n=1 Tax=Triplophysa dalaica TaxID=1582913 RepID=UPI0024DFF96C|nr:cytosolic phospholipase A2 gamma-like isoform X2 [Triplophysa dalaica]